MKNSSIKGFSLVEIIVSTIILTIGVFWVYKLIGNNMALLWKNETILTMKTLEKNLQQCILYLSENGSNFTGSGFSIYFWDDLLWCEKWTFEENYNFTGVVMNNQTFFLYGKEDNLWQINYNIFSPEVGKLFQEKDKLFLLKK